MYSNEHTLQDVLRKAYHKLDLDDVANEIEVKVAYKQVVGDFINRLTWSIKFADGTLTVQLASAALKQELFYKRTSLADRINEAIGKNAVKKIVFV
ncbi:MAG: DUF721 domain-containing protein [Bacteroidales bacterium]|nr:DUF721 domain-containing protein [Candidatus Colimorpha merdihippi]MCQ2281784.1 DUF721 domain-containing protein [Bacteroidales bacterium]